MKIKFQLTIVVFSMSADFGSCQNKFVKSQYCLLKTANQLLNKEEIKTQKCKKHKNNELMLKAYQKCNNVKNIIIMIGQKAKKSFNGFFDIHLIRERERNNFSRF